MTDTASLRAASVETTWLLQQVATGAIGMITISRWGAQQMTSRTGSQQAGSEATGSQQAGS
jgi:hypothetical protein